MNATVHSADVIVIGAGIAGAGIAAELAPGCRVLVLEQEAQPGYHTTGRSAAVFSESYGGATVRCLSRGSREFLARPPAGFAAGSLLSPRGFLFIARADQREALDALAGEPDLRASARRLSGTAAAACMPLLRPGHVAEALLDETASDIDVHALHQGYLARLRSHGGQLRCGTPVTAIERRSGNWRLHSGAASFEAPLLVNAAGAWADQMAQLAGVRGVGLQPLRRTAALVDAPGLESGSPWPLTIDIDEQFYFKPDAGRLLISPGDETPSPPGDAMPEDLDLALAVDRIEAATTLDIRRMHSRWAGLRSFVADRSPVAGFAPDAPGFFWLAGQGGYGIQTAPALSRFAAAQLLGRALPGDLRDLGLDAAALSAARLRGSACASGGG